MLTRLIDRASVPSCRLAQKHTNKSPANKPRHARAARPGARTKRRKLSQERQTENLLNVESSNNGAVA
jgi:hypothetical protein